MRARPARRLSSVMGIIGRTATFHELQDTRSLAWELAFQTTINSRSTKTQNGPNSRLYLPLIDRLALDSSSPL
jgi:hypothetical protein